MVTYEAEDIATQALPPVITDILENVPGTFLAGGALRSIYDLTKIEDYDIFFQDERVKERTLTQLGRKGIISKYGSDKVLNFNRYGHDVQICALDYYPDAQTLVQDFDMCQCQFVLWNSGGMWYSEEGSRAVECATNKQIGINLVKAPARTVSRITKYVEKKDYKITSETWDEFFKKSAAVSHVPTKNQASYESPTLNALEALQKAVEANQIDTSKIHALRRII